MNSLFLNPHLSRLKIWVLPNDTTAEKAGNTRERYICPRPVSNTKCSTESTVTCKAGAACGETRSVVHSLVHGEVGYAGVVAFRDNKWGAWRP